VPEPSPSTSDTTQAARSGPSPDRLASRARHHSVIDARAAPPKTPARAAPLPNTAFRREAGARDTVLASVVTPTAATTVRQAHAPQQPSHATVTSAQSSDRSSVKADSVTTRKAGLDERDRTPTQSQHPNDRAVDAAALSTSRAQEDTVATVRT